MSGAKKPQQVKPTPVQSQYSGVNTSVFGSDFGTGTSTKSGNALTTTTQLADFLQPIPTQAGQGIQSNLAFLQQTPQQQYEQATGGQNPLYNVLQEQSRRGMESALGRSLVDAQGTGTTNSTTAGAARGTILNDAIMRANSDLLNAISFSNQQAQANVNTGLDTLGSLANLTYPLGSAANGDLVKALGQQDTIALANAQSRLQADTKNAELMQQYEQQKAKSLGGMLGGAGSLIGTGLGALLAVPTGGLSLLGGAALGGALGGGAGGLLGGAFGGGGGGGGSNYLPPSVNFNPQIGIY